jgi:hypothetical protein
MLHQGNVIRFELFLRIALLLGGFAEILVRVRTPEEPLAGSVVDVGRVDGIVDRFGLDDPEVSHAPEQPLDEGSPGLLLRLDLGDVLPGQGRNGNARLSAGEPRPRIEQSLIASMGVAADGRSSPVTRIRLACGS